MTTIVLTLHEEDPEERDQQIRLLRDDLRELDVEVTTPEGEEVPEDAKGVDPQTLSTIIVAVSSSPVLIQLGRVLAAFVDRSRTKVTIKDGNRSVDIHGPVSPEMSHMIESVFRNKEIQ